MGSSEMASEIITRLQLIALPKEGGWFRELRKVQTDGMPPLPVDQGAVGDDVEGSSSIYYLLKEGEMSAWHKLTTDEYWCYHSGQNMRLHLISSDGKYESVSIGQGTSSHFQYLVPKGTWNRAELQSSETAESTNYSLVSCVNVPPFTWDAFQVSCEEEIQQKFPQYKKAMGT